MLWTVQVMHEPCYDALRTKQQLGYTVHCGVRLTHGVLGFAVVVVSGVGIALVWRHAVHNPSSLLLQSGPVVPFLWCCAALLVPQWLQDCLLNFGIVMESL